MDCCFFSYNTCNLDWMANTGAMMDCNLMDSLANMLVKLDYNLKFYTKRSNALDEMNL